MRNQRDNWNSYSQEPLNPPHYIVLALYPFKSYLYHNGHQNVCHSYLRSVHGMEAMEIHYTPNSEAEEGQGIAVLGPM